MAFILFFGSTNAVEWIAFALPGSLGSFDSKSRGSVASDHRCFSVPQLPILLLLQPQESLVVIIYPSEHMCNT